ncbi:hypothetical protein [Serratia sp. M24T3]|uniref:hypothetical protein n=1 Tax=Serratia sp. M24T3 TaxID=932213 RepID=UPI00025BAB1A|nr:hypothetical protein [Serratia sp. M24T3]EIC82084.1 hypothetical protein SPM24T3_23647 [Serratia sp. M24T3]
MSEQQLSQLLEAMKSQTAAMNRLAESNETLVALIVQNLDDGGDFEKESTGPTYLSGAPVRG